MMGKGRGLPDTGNCFSLAAPAPSITERVTQHTPELVHEVPLDASFRWDRCFAGRPVTTGVRATVKAAWHGKCNISKFEWLAVRGVRAGQGRSWRHNDANRYSTHLPMQ